MIDDGEDKGVAGGKRGFRIFPMGNPHSGVLACLFLEFLDPALLNSDYLVTPHILDILTIYLLSYTKNTKIEEIAEKLNNVEPFINFTSEKTSSWASW